MIHGSHYWRYNMLSLSPVSKLKHWLAEQKASCCWCNQPSLLGMFWECLVMLVVGRVPLTWEQISFWLLINTYFQNGTVYLWPLILWEHTHGKLDSGPSSRIWWLIPISLTQILGTLLQNLVQQNNKVWTWKLFHLYSLAENGNLYLDWHGKY